MNANQIDMMSRAAGRTRKALKKRANKKKKQTLVRQAQQNKLRPQTDDKKVETARWASPASRAANDRR